MKHQVSYQWRLREVMAAFRREEHLAADRQVSPQTFAEFCAGGGDVYQGRFWPLSPIPCPHSRT